MAESGLQAKAEAALKYWVTTQAATALGSVIVYTGLGTTEIVLPSVIVKADLGPEEIEYTGLYRLQFSVAIHSAVNPDSDLSETLAEKLTQHNALAAGVFEVVNTTTISDDISGTGTNFHAYKAFNFRFNSQRVEGAHMISELIFEAVCCGQTL